MLKFNDFINEAKLSAKQKKIAAVAGDKDKIDAEDLAALRNGAKVECKEEAEQIDELDKKTLGNYVKKSHDQLMKHTGSVNMKFGRGDKDAVSYSLDKTALRKTANRTKGMDQAIDRLTKEETVTEDVDKAALRKQYKDNESNNNHTENAALLAKHFGSKRDQNQVAKAKAYRDKHNGYGGDILGRHHANLAHEIHKKLYDKLHEEAEQIDELSKDTLNSYVKGAATDLPRYGNTLGRLQTHGKLKDVEKTLGRSITNRHRGIARAVDKLTKEEVEQIDEGKMKDIYTSMMMHADKKGYSSHKEFTPADYDTVGKEHGISGKDLAVIAGHKTAQQAANEAVDTIKKDASGKVTSWSHEGDWKKSTAKDGAGKAANLAGQALKKTQALSKEEVEHIEEKLSQIDELSKGTLGRYVNKASLKAAGHAYNNNTDKAFKRLDGIKTAVKKLTKEEASSYLTATLRVMDEGKIDNLRDAQALRKDNTSAYSKNYKPDTSHPHIQVVKGNAYGGANQKDDEGDEKKPDNETQEKRGRGRPTGKVGKYKARGSKSVDKDVDDREFQLHLPK